MTHRWSLRHANEQKKGFKFREFVADDVALARAYDDYLQKFPAIFEKELPADSELVLEEGYAAHKVHDLKVLKSICLHLKLALEHAHDRPKKSLNLYLWSHNPSFGKTRLLNFLDEHMMTYRLPDDQVLCGLQK